MKPSTVLYRLRLVASCALAGSVFTGVFFSWIHAPFDLHYVGAGLGALIGIVTVSRLP